MSFVATLDGANIQHESALVNTQNVEKMMGLLGRDRIRVVRGVRGIRGARGGCHGATLIGVIGVMGVIGCAGRLSRRNRIKGR